MFESMEQVFGFQREFWRNRAQTGSVKASSSRLACAMVEPLWDGSENLDVLELGCGTGVISEQIFSSMPPNGRLTIVEINRNFLAMTRAKMSRRFGRDVIDDCVSFVHEDFLKHRLPANGFSRICCSLPLNNFSPETIAEIFGEMLRICRPGGVIAFYEYILLRRMRYWLSLGLARNLKRIENVLNEHIYRLGIGRLPIFSNFPPAMVYLLRKPKCNGSS